MTTREAFERGTDTFNAHDLAGFADVLADDVAFVAPGGVRGEGKAACAAFFGAWFGAFPDAHIEVHGLPRRRRRGRGGGHLHRHARRRPPHPQGDVAPTGRAVRIDYLQMLRFRDGRHVPFNLMFDRLLMLEQLGLVPAAAGR